MTERLLFSSALFDIAEFECPAGDEAWRAVNVIESRSPLVVFPHAVVGIRTSRDDRVLATPNLVMLYNPDQAYERELHDARGDRCVFVALHAPAAAALEEECGVVRNGRMTATHAPASRTAYLHQHLIARHLGGDRPDRLLVEEATMRLLRSVVRHQPGAHARRRTTDHSHRALAEDAKALLAASLSEQLGLQELAARLGTSPFHLGRVFRAQTGYSLHQYRKHLRLRLALERLPECRGALTALAFELGFASHSHFTDTFRREFGVAPTALGDERHLRRLLAA
jgi:AraC family transcriptional regulator